VPINQGSCANLVSAGIAIIQGKKKAADSLQESAASSIDEVLQKPY
jgi:hypothetical protein